ncbi:MAG: rRNA maturation RNase YbeY [Actinobacteria bacterium]|nr:rRNA maturation RNase YbeY [Actinomycetota bacterium]
MAIEITTRAGVVGNESNLASLLAFAISELGLHPACELNVVLVDPTEMTELHITWMHEEGPTDVLSFPMDELRRDSHEEGVLGDIVLCPDVAQEQALDAGHSAEHELSILSIHGLLHLIGYDHANPKDEKIMFNLQEDLVSRWKT